jgi:hypothetical protein
MVPLGLLSTRTFRISFARVESSTAYRLRSMIGKRTSGRSSGKACPSEIAEWIRSNTVKNGYTDHGYTDTGYNDSFFVRTGCRYSHVILYMSSDTSTTTAKIIQNCRGQNFPLKCPPGPALRRIRTDEKCSGEPSEEQKVFFVHWKSRSDGHFRGTIGPRQFWILFAVE